LYRRSLLEWFRAHGSEPDVAQTLSRHKDAALVLWHLDLEPAQRILRACYAAKPHGGDPWPPLVMLRCLLLGALVGEPRINFWVPMLKASRVLRVLCGLPAEGDCPGVGTFYDFMNRLHDGPIRRACEHQQRPSEAQRRRAKTPRAPKKKPEKPKLTREQKRERKRQRQKDAVTADVIELSATDKVLAELKATQDNPNPNDLLGRLSALLLEVGVMESARRGLLGNLKHLTVSGDSSSLVTWANGNGGRICAHGRTERCDCPRLYPDPDAAWGYDSYREVYFFGYKYYELVTAARGHDLPLFIGLNPANMSDFTALPRALEHLLKSFREHQLPWAIGAMPLDCGHDAEPIYRYLIEQRISPVIPLKQDAPAVHPQRPELPLSPRGVPLCQAGAEMAPWGSAGADRKVFVCPVKAHQLEKCPIAPPEDPGWLCRPDTAWAPTVSVPVSLNPRLCPPIPRNSARYTELYKLRSASERSNSVKKEPFALEAAHHRRASFWLIRLHLIGLLQHARAWAAEEQLTAEDLVDHLLGRVKQAKAS
jgi:hypothetical protein